jgi:two-component system LytT family response regulator
MNALICLPCASQSLALYEMLCQYNTFDKVERVAHHHQLARSQEQWRNTVVFCLAKTDIPTDQSVIWVAIGENNSDALQAYEKNAAGFLCSPFSRQQIEKLDSVLIAKIAREKRHQQYQSMLQGLCKQYGVAKSAVLSMLRQRYLQHTNDSMMSIKSDDGWLCLNPNEIKWIEAAGDYMCIQTVSQNIVARTTMCNLIAKLQNEDFLRCSRSTVVNTRFLECTETRGNRLHAVMSDGVTFRVSQKYLNLHWLAPSAVNSLRVQE